MKRNLPISLSSPSLLKILVVGVIFGFTSSLSSAYGQHCKMLIFIYPDICDTDNIVLHAFPWPTMVQPITYQWSTGESTQDITVPNVAGTYSVTVSDAAGCVVSNSLVISDPAVFDFFIEMYNGCPGEDIFLTVEWNQLEAPLNAEYLWSTGETTAIISTTTPGIYSVTITDPATGCSTVRSRDVQFFPGVYPVITGPTSLCNTASVTLTVTGGPFFAYFWDPFVGDSETVTITEPGTYTVTVQSEDNCFGTATIDITSGNADPVIGGTTTLCSGGQGMLEVVNANQFSNFLWSTGDVTPDIAISSPGIYSVTVSDGTGCSSSQSFTVDEAGFTITGAVTTPVTSCSAPNGSIDISVSPFNTYNFLWSNGATSEDLVNLPSGNFSVTVTNPEGCMETISAFVGNNTSQPLLFPAITDALCNQATGSIDLSVTPAAGNSYLWSNGTTTEDLTNLPPGPYAVTVTGANGCVSTGSYQIVNTNNNFSVTASPMANTSCILPNGSIDVSVNASGSFSYLWSNGSTDQDLSSLPSGTYSVTVTDADGCMESASATVATTAADPVLTPVIVNALCNQATGSIDLSVTPAIGNSFLWSNGTTTEDLTDLPPGPYSVTVTGANGCVSTGSYQIVNTNNNFSVTASPMANTSCILPNGSIDVSVNASGSFSYLWSNGSTDQDLSSLPSGTYSVTVTDADGCMESASATVATTAADPVLTPVIVNALCNQATGSIDLSVTPAIGNSFLWSNGTTTEDLTDLPPGPYSVTVTGANGCVSTGSYQIVNTNNNFSVTASPMANTSCILPNGSIDVSVNASGSFSYLWSNGSTDQDLSSLPSGTYSVTVTDADGCMESASATVATTAADPVLTPVIVNALCNQATGSIDLSVTPAIGNSFLWSNGTTTEDLTDLPPGPYSVTVTGANGCVSTGSYQIVNTNNNFSVTASPMANTSCILPNGSIDVSVNASGSFSYLWSNGSTDQDLSSLPSGTYSVTVTDADGCMESASATVATTAADPVLTPVIVNALCNQATGSIDLSVTPASGNSFLWSNGATDEDLLDIPPGNYAVTCTGSNGCITIDTLEVLNSNSNFVISSMSTANTSCTAANGAIDLTITPFGSYSVLWSTGATDEDLQNIATGGYSVTVTDASSCSDILQVDIDGPVPPQVAISEPATVCEGESVVLSADPGFVVYQWSDGQTTESISITEAGTYTLTVTDANGCMATTSQIFVNLPLPTPVIDGLDFICGDSTDFLVSGGSFFQMIWNTGDTTASISVFQSGTYIVTVTDVNGCEASVSHELTVGTAPVPVVAGTTTACDGTATLNAGAGFTSYVWSNGVTGQEIIVNADGSYTVTVTDLNGCVGEDTILIAIPTPPQLTISGDNFVCTGDSTIFSIPDTFPQTLWSTGASTAAIQVSQEGSYSVTVTDANGCSASDEVMLTVFPLPSPLLTTTTTNCNGTVTLNAEQGFVTYIWSNGTIGPQIVVNVDGVFSVTVTDANGCMGTASENVIIPALPQVQIVGAPHLCEGDETVLAASGNFLQYLWSTGETTSEITISQGGVYAVTVIDTNGCMANDELTVTQLQTSYTNIEVTSCSVQDTGIVSVLLSNLFGCDSLVVTHTVLALPVLRQVQLNACPGESAVFNGVVIPAGGQQEFVFTAANGCDSIVAVSVAAFPAMNFSLSSTETCWNSANGSIQVSAWSGTPPYQYSLNGIAFQTASTFTDLSGGNYTVEAEDANGCVFSQEIEVPQTIPTQVTTEDVSLSCEEGMATIRPLVFAAHPEALRWQWADGSDNPWLLVTEPGVYAVSIDDGCEVMERSIEVAWEAVARKKDLFYVPNSFSPNGDGINDVFRVFPGQDFEVLSFEFRIFDRWGDAMYMTTTMDGAWDGVFRGIEMQPAVYAWFVKAKVQLCGGRIIDVFRKGDVTIVR